MSKTVRLYVDVELDDYADEDLAADHLSDLIGTDPDDLCAEIESITDWGVIR